MGQVISGLVMGGLAGNGDWRTLFLIGGFAPLVVALALFVALPDSPRFLARAYMRDRSPRTGRALVTVLGRLGLPPVPTNDQNYVISDEVELGSVVRHADPRLLFAGPLLALTPLIWLVEILTVFVSGFYTYWTPTLARLLGAGPVQASHAMSSFALGAMLGPLVLTRIMDRFGRSWVAAGPAAAALFFGAFGLKLVVGIPVTGLVFVIGMLALGVQMSLGSLFFQIYPTGIRTYAIGWVILIGGLGSISSPIVAGRLIDAGANPFDLFQLSALAMAGAAPLAFLLARRAERDVFTTSHRAGEV
jgi:AAHS family 4-hydroxybenzoate transporter-like MFS transporter